MRDVLFKLCLVTLAVIGFFVGMAVYTFTLNLGLGSLWHWFEDSPLWFSILGLVGWGYVVLTVVEWHKGEK